MSELTIVTAFYDIGRKDFEIISRTNEKYFQHFECWARINNKLVVYTQSQFKDAILQIRRKYNQEENTVIITLDDIDSIDREILDRYTEIAEAGHLENFKFLKGTIAANKPRYIYLMLLKYWFMMDASKRGLIDDFAVWLDFGYGHGDYFKNPEEFNFKWSWDFKRKITLFTCHDLDEVPMYEVVRCSLNYIMGFMVVAPKELCQNLWEYVREAAYMLSAMGFIDDDQTVLLSAYRNHKEDFAIEASDWFYPLISHGGGHLTLSRPKVEVVPVERKGIKKLVDKFRAMTAKDPLKEETQKLARDCAERTYSVVYELYLKDRRN